MKTRIGILMLVLGCLIAISVYAAEEDNTETSEAVTAAAAPEAKTVPLETEKDKLSYIIGTQMAASIKRAKIDVNVESLLQGLKDALEGKPPKLSMEEMQKVYGAFQQKMRQQQAAEQAKAQAAKSKVSAENLAKGTAFLEANKTKEGVVVTESGLQYKILTEGTGKSPKTSDKVKAHYRGTFIDGKEFDSSYKRGVPTEFGVTGVIKGWTEALQLMKEGSKWELYIPANLAYGEPGRGSIGPNSTLIFQVELVEVVEQ